MRGWGGGGGGDRSSGRTGMARATNGQAKMRGRRPFVFPRGWLLAVIMWLAGLRGRLGYQQAGRLAWLLKRVATLSRQVICRLFSSARPHAMSSREPKRTLGMPGRAAVRVLAVPPAGGGGRSSSNRIIGNARAPGSGAKPARARPVTRRRVDGQAGAKRNCRYTGEAGKSQRRREAAGQ